MIELYSRIVSKREAINRYGKLGFNYYLEFVYTEDISQFNYRKKVKFQKCENVDYLYLIKLNQNYHDSMKEPNKVHTILYKRGGLNDY